jgi:lysophospholipase L1-like esterase
MHILPVRLAARPAVRAVRMAATLAFALALAGCSRCPDVATSKVVACLGDSNTHQPAQTGWCEILAQESEGSSLRFLNYGFPGAAAVPPPPRFPILDASYWLDRALALAPPAVVILAYGTNDLRYEMSPQQVLEGYRELKQRAEKAGARVLIALTPPMAPKKTDKSAEVVQLNDLLRATFPPQDLVDFNTGFDVKTDLTPDGLHFTESGHRKRAEAVRRALKANGFDLP